MKHLCAEVPSTMGTVSLIIINHLGVFELTFVSFEDMTMFCAMGPPGGGRSQISSRMVRQFNLLAYNELD